MLVTHCTDTKPASTRLNFSQACLTTQLAHLAISSKCTDQSTLPPVRRPPDITRMSPTQAGLGRKARSAAFNALCRTFEYTHQILGNLAEMSSMPVLYLYSQPYRLFKKGSSASTTEHNGAETSKRDPLLSSQGLHPTIRTNLCT